MILEDVLIVDPIDGEYVGVIEFDKYIENLVRKESKTTFKYILMPGFIDPHIHGIKGIDTMTMTKSDYKKFREYEALEGVCYFLPTTVTTELENLKNVLTVDGANYHIEGPFISILKKGAHDEKFIVEPNIDFLKSINLSKIKLITMAPELNKFFETATFLQNNGIVVSIGHSNANFVTAKRAYESGFKRITHFPNALSPLHHREIGMVGAGFYLDFSIELICDGIHLSADFVRLVYKIKGAEKIILVTDSISATGLKDGKYKLGTLDVFIEDGIAKLSDGTLAGSTLTFSKALKNFQKFTGCSLKELARVSSYNSAVELRLNVGRIEKNYEAKFVLLDKELNVVKTIGY